MSGIGSSVDWLQLILLLRFPEINDSVQLRFSTVKYMECLRAETVPVQARRKMRRRITMQDAKMMKNCFKSIWLLACCACMVEVCKT